MMEEEVLPDGKMNIFSKTVLTEPVKKMVGTRELDNFSSPLLNKAALKDKIGLLERVLGRSSSQVNVITDEIMKDILMATDYPPEIESLLRPSEEVIASAHDLCDYLGTLKGGDTEKSTTST